jgi:hypothetical protein
MSPVTFSLGLELGNLGGSEVQASLLFFISLIFPEMSRCGAIAFLYVILLYLD